MLVFVPVISQAVSVLINPEDAATGVPKKNVELFIVRPQDSCPVRLSPS